MRITMQLMTIQAIIMHLVCLPPVFQDIKSPLTLIMVVGLRMIDAFYCTFSVMYLSHLDNHFFCNLCSNLFGIDILMSKCLCVHKKLGALTKAFSVGFLIRCLISSVIAQQVSPTSIITYLIEMCTLLYYMLIGIIIPIPFGIKMLYLLLNLFPMTILSYKLSDKLVVTPVLLAVMLLIILISYYFVSFSRKKNFFSIEATRNMVTILGGQIMNLFLNALPSKLVPNIMSGVRMEPTVCSDVCFSYIAVSDAVSPNATESIVNNVDADNQKIDDATKGFMSRLNLYYCLLDFLSECIGVQKVKSTYTLYMVAAGLESILDICYKGPIDDLLLRGDGDQSNRQIEKSLLQADPLGYKERIEKLKFKQIATFCLAARLAGESLGFNVSAGITKGPIITGMLGQGQANCNFDVWGDVVNMAARIARGFNSGVFIKQDDFYTKTDETISNSYYRAGSYTSFEDDYSTVILKNDLEKKRQDVSRYLPSEDIVKRSREIIYNLPPCYMFGMSFPRMYKGKSGVTWITELVETDYMPWLLRRTFSLAYRNLLLSYVTEGSQQDLGIPTGLISPKHHTSHRIKQNTNVTEAKQLTGFELFETIKKNLGLEQNDQPHIDNALAVVTQRNQLDTVLFNLKMYVYSESKEVHESDIILINQDYLAVLKGLSTLATANPNDFITRQNHTKVLQKDSMILSSFLSDNSIRRLIYCVYSGDYSLLEHGGEFIDLRICFGLPGFLSHVKIETGPVSPEKHLAMLRLQHVSSTNQSNTVDIRSESSDEPCEGLTNSQLMIESIYKTTDTAAGSQFHRTHLSSLITNLFHQRSGDRYRTTNITIPSSSQDFYSTMRQSTDGISSSMKNIKGRYRKQANLQILQPPDPTPNAVEEYFFVQPDIKPLTLGSFNTSSLRISDTILTPRVLTNPTRHDFHDVPKLGTEKNNRKVTRAIPKGQKILNKIGSAGMLRIDEDSQEADGLMGRKSALLQLKDLGINKKAISASRETSGDDTEYSLASVTRRYASGESMELPNNLEYTKSKLGKQKVVSDDSGADQHFKDITLMDLPHQSISTAFDDKLEETTMQSVGKSFAKVNYSFKDLLPPIQAPSDNIKALRNRTSAPSDNINHSLTPLRPLVEIDADSDNMSVSHDDLLPNTGHMLSLATPISGNHKELGTHYSSPERKTVPLIRSNSQPHWNSRNTAKTVPIFGSCTTSIESLEPLQQQQVSDASKFNSSKPMLQRSTSSIRGDSSVSSLLQGKQIGRAQQRASSHSRTPQQQPQQQNRMYAQRSASVSAEQRVQNFFTFFNTSATATPTPTKADAFKNATILDSMQVESMVMPQGTGYHGRSISFVGGNRHSFPFRDNQSSCSSKPMSTITTQKSQSNIDSYSGATKGVAYSKASDFTEQDTSLDISTVYSKKNLMSREACIHEPESDECTISEDRDRTSITAYTTSGNDVHDDEQIYTGIQPQGRIPISLLSFQIFFGVATHVRKQIELLCSISSLISKRCTEEIGFAFMVTGMMRAKNYCIDLFIILAMYVSFSIISCSSRFNRDTVIFFFNSKIYFSDITYIYWAMLGINILWQISFSIYLRFYDGVRRAVKLDFDKATERGENSDNLGRDLLFNKVIIGARVVVTLTTVVCMYLIQCFYSIGFYYTLNNSINEEPNIVALLIFFMLPFQFFYIVTILSTTSNSIFFISYNFIALIVATTVLIIASFCGQLVAVLINLIMLVAAFIYASTKMRIRISILDWKASVANQIKTYKERLNPILPGMTIDVMIAAKQPEAISSTEGVFQFIESYMRDLNHMICINELEKASQIRRVGATPITDAPQSRVPPIDFSSLKVDRDLVPNTSPFIPLEDDTADNADCPGLITETGQKNKHYWLDFCQDAKQAVEARSKELYKGLIYNMHQYLHFSDPRYLSYDRPIVYFARVGYLSLDIVNFTRLSSEHDAKSILRFLGDLFSEFDKRIDRAPQLKQIKSIGDAYEVMGLPGMLKKYGNSGKRRNKHPYGQKEDDRILQLYDGLLLLVMAGFGFIQDCMDINKKHFNDKVDYLGLRVGVCTGIAFGSLLGSKQFRFDVFGNVPEEADSIQSEASTNAIFISSDVKKILEEGELKWKSRFHEYQVEQEALGVQVPDIQNEHLSFTFAKHVKNSITMYEVKSIDEMPGIDYIHFFSQLPVSQ